MCCGEGGEFSGNPQRAPGTRDTTDEAGRGRRGAVTALTPVPASPQAPGFRQPAGGAAGEHDPERPGGGEPRGGGAHVAAARAPPASAQPSQVGAPGPAAERAAPRRRDGQQGRAGPVRSLAITLTGNFVSPRTLTLDLPPPAAPQQTQVPRLAEPPLTGSWRTTAPSPSDFLPSVLPAPPPPAPPHAPSHQ